MNRKAFTIIELLIVILTLGILSGFVISQMSGVTNIGKDMKRKVDINIIKNAIVSYSAENFSKKPISASCYLGSDCPSTLDALTPFLGTPPKDPSGTYYVYESDGNECTVYAVLSDGNRYQYQCSTNEIAELIPANGACGSSNGAGFYTAPAANLCADNSTPAVSGSGPWTWTCSGINGGNNQSCTANKSIDAVCGSATGSCFGTAPTTNLCADGSTPPVSGPEWAWTCSGQNNGASVSCTARMNGTALNGGPHTDCQCSATVVNGVAGIPYDVGSGITICKLHTNSCSNVSGWTQYQSWTATQSNTGGAYYCSGTCNSGSHVFSNAATEWCTGLSYACWPQYIDSCAGFSYGSGALPNNTSLYCGQSMGPGPNICSCYPGQAFYNTTVSTVTDVGCY